VKRTAIRIAGWVRPEERRISLHNSAYFSHSWLPNLVRGLHLTDWFTGIIVDAKVILERRHSERIRSGNCVDGNHHITTKEDRTLKTSLFICALCALFLSVAVMVGPVSAQTAEGAKISLNKATAAQLSKVPGLGSGLAKAIADYRQKNGPFKKAEDVAKVPGMTKEIMKKANIQDSKGDVVAPAPKGGGEDDEEGPSLKPSKC
jgi:competence ComEA-like helix-hairpin-helix protein